MMTVPEKELKSRKYRGIFSHLKGADFILTVFQKKKKQCIRKSIY